MRSDASGRERRIQLSRSVSLLFMLSVVCSPLFPAAAAAADPPGLLEESYHRFALLHDLPLSVFGMPALYLLVLVPVAGGILAMYVAFRSSRKRSVPGAAPISKIGSRSGPQSFAAMTVKAWYLVLLILSGLLALFMGILGESGFCALFGGIALYFIIRRRHLQKVRAAASSGAGDGGLAERGGMPLAAIAVASILLAGSAASFYTNISAINPPDDGICDYDHRPASALYQRIGRDGSAGQTQEFCDAHIGYFLVLHPLQSYGLASESGSNVTFMGLSLGWWAEIFAGLWIAFISLMVLASINVGSRGTTGDPLFIVCGLKRGMLSMATGFVATILLIIIAVDLMVGFSDPAAGYRRLLELLDATGMNLAFYLATMLVIIAFLAAFFRQRGSAG